jgi:D-alanyl-D-alanine carboxypeptidase/D-alanyl-D-alanine-endopeptidase (penicillin-binding protein 4)
MMNQTRASRVAFLVLLSFVFSATTPANALFNAQRARRASATQKSSPSGSSQRVAPTPTPGSTLNPIPGSTPSSASSPAATPQVSTSAAVGESQERISTRAKTLSELQTRISAILRKPELEPVMVGIKVTSLDTGRILFEENATKLLRPASNMKMYTVATALDRLSPDYHFTTSVFSRARPDTGGIIHGDLTIYGRGDPSLAARFNNGDYFKAIDDLASRIAAAGVKRVEGDLIGDESYFTGPQYGSGWEWEDLTWYYGAEVSSLTVNDNALDIFVKPGIKIGNPATVTTGPPDPLLTISNQVTTGERGSRREISLYRGLGENTVTISGSIPLDDRGYSGGVAISRPALLFVYLLRAALVHKGVSITGRSRTIGGMNQRGLIAETAIVNRTNGSSFAVPLSSQNEIATLQSPPFGLIAAQTLKPSQNLYTELILRTLGKLSSPSTLSNSGETSEDAGLEAVKNFLKTAGIRPESLVLSDGSGLSRNDMVTAEASVQLLTFMSRHRYSEVFRQALPIAGVDGTLRNRMKGTAAENNVRAKTGSLSSAASLSGYVTSGAGEKLVFSIMVNNFPSDLEPRVICIDPIAVLLASFAGRSE